MDEGITAKILLRVKLRRTGAQSWQGRQPVMNRE
jgi:hypothetical protein